MENLIPPNPMTQAVLDYLDEHPVTGANLLSFQLARPADGEMRLTLVVLPDHDPLLHAGGE